MPVAGWMGSVLLIILGVGGLNWYDYSINITLIHYEVPFALCRFESRAVNRETVAILTPSLSRFYIMGFNP